VRRWRGWQHNPHPNFDRHRRGFLGRHFLDRLWRRFGHSGKWRDFWGVYTSGDTIVGALFGNTTSSATALTGSGLDFNISARTVTPGTYSGTFSDNSSIQVTTQPSGVTFSGRYDAAYDVPASLATLAGTFVGLGVSGGSPVQPITATITADGAIAVPASLGCSASGTATPRPTGKNIFNVSVTFVGSKLRAGKWHHRHGHWLLSSLDP
jgi:hypothetical protein